MATKIELGLSTYLINFAGGQTPYRSGTNYVQYATDHDTNYVTLRNTINQVIDELAAVQGPNAALGVDILVFNDTERLSSGEPNDAAGVNDTGFVGLHSFEPVIATTSTANDSVQIDPGLIVVNGVAVRNAAGATKVGTGLATGTKYIAVDLAGAIYLENSANQRAADLFSITWTGSPTNQFSGAFTRLQQMFFDGDEYEAMRARPAAGTTPATFPARRYEAFRYRMEAVERLLAGFTTDSLGNALGQLAIPAGSQGTPGLTFNGDPNTGIYSSAADVVNITTGGNNRITIGNTSILPQVSIHGIAGSATDPTYSYATTPDTGMYFPGNDRIGFTNNGTQSAELDATGNLDLPTNSRVKGIAPSQSITEATATLVDFSTADAFDVGNWHDHASGTLATRQSFTVPTGADGLYLINAFFEWAVSTPALNIVTEITVDTGGGSPGVPIAEKIEARIVANTGYSGVLSAHVVLAAGNIVRMRVTQDDPTAGTAALNLESATLSIVKLA